MTCGTGSNRGRSRRRRVGTLERGWLWCKRRPAVAGLSAAVLAALVGGAISSTVLWLLAERNYRAEQVARRDANQRYELAMDAIKTFHTGVSEDALLTQPELKELRNRLLMPRGRVLRPAGHAA